MEKIRIAVLDDNKAILGTIAASIENVFRSHDYEPQVDCFTTAKKLTSEYDLYLLDISLVEEDGIEFAKVLKQKDKMADIIFVSSREDRVFDALQVHPYGFIRKNRFLQDVATVISGYIEDLRKRTTDRTLVINAKGQTLRFDLDDIIYIESSGRNQSIFLASRKDPAEISESMEDLEQKLKVDGFVRVHKGYLVNCKYIRLIQTTDLLLLDGRSVPVSRRKLTELKEAYMNYMQRGGAKTLQ